jgi:5-keto-L-gluconate epimerase
MKLAVTATPSAGRFAPILLRGDVSSAFDLAAQLGYDGVELHVRNPADVDASLVCRLMQRYGLQVPTVGTGLAAGEDGLTFTDPDPAVRDRALRRIKEHIILATQISSAVTVGLIWGRVGHDPAQRLGRMAAALDCLQQCCRAAAEAGVTILFEPLNRFESDYPNTLAEATDVIAKVNTSNVRLLADTFHMNIEERDMCAGLRSTSSLLGHIHLADSNRQVPGNGHSDLNGIIATLHEIGYSGWLAFEVLPVPSPEQGARDAIAGVKALPAFRSGHG